MIDLIGSLLANVNVCAGGPQPAAPHTVTPHQQPVEHGEVDGGGAGGVQASSPWSGIALHQLLMGLLSYKHALVRQGG